MLATLDFPRPVGETPTCESTQAAVDALLDSGLPVCLRSRLTLWLISEKPSSDCSELAIMCWAGSASTIDQSDMFDSNPDLVLKYRIGKPMGQLPK